MKKIILISLSLILLGFVAMPEISAQNDSKIVKLTESNFTKETKSGLVLVDFYADWCRPCKMMQPILEDVAGEQVKHIVIAKVNTDHNKTLSQKFGISGIPCMILFKDGKEITRIIGYHEKTALMAKLEPHFSK